MNFSIRVVMCTSFLVFGSLVQVQACMPLFCTCAKIMLTVAGQVLEEEAIKLLHKEITKLDEPVLADLEEACRDEKHALSERSIGVLAPKNIFLNDDASVKRVVKVLVPVFVQTTAAENEKHERKAPAKAVITVVALKQGLQRGIADKIITVQE